MPMLKLQAEFTDMLVLGRNVVIFLQGGGGDTMMWWDT